MSNFTIPQRDIELELLNDYRRRLTNIQRRKQQGMTHYWNAPIDKRIAELRWEIMCWRSQVTLKHAEQRASKNLLAASRLAWARLVHEYRQKHQNLEAEIERVNHSIENVERCLHRGRPHGSRKPYAPHVRQRYLTKLKNFQTERDNCLNQLGSLAPPVSYVEWQVYFSPKSSEAWLRRQLEGIGT